MPIDNYVNPSSLAPQIGYQPQGALAGMDYANRLKDFQEQLGLSKVVQQMAIKRQEGENADFETTRPSALASTIATNQATAQTAVPKAEEALKTQQLNNETQVLTNRFKSGTLDSEIATKLAGNLDEQGAAGQKQLGRTLQFAQVVGAMHDQAPGSVTPEQIKAMGSQFGVPMDSPMMKTLMTDPGTAKRWASLIDSADSEYRQKKELAKEKDDAEYKKAIEVATITAKAHVAGSALAANAAGFESKYLISSYVSETKRLHPEWTPEQVGAAAADRLATSKYGLGGGKLENTDTAATRAANADNAKVVADLEKTLAMVGKDSEIGKNIQSSIDKLKVGTTAPAAISGIPKISSAAEYEALPPGDYIDPTGVKRTKKAK